MQQRRFFELDVFAGAPGRGNPLGVVADARDLDSTAMQAIAAWLNLSETTFLLPASQSGADYRLRIFTPRQELPFAGHPSVGTAHAVLELGLMTPRHGRLVQECGAGLLPIEVAGEGSQRRIHVRAPKGVERRTEATAILRTLGTDRLGTLRPVVIDNGPLWWCIELADETVVRTLTPDLPAMAAVCTETRTTGVAVFARCTGQHYALVVRAFVPAGGIPEDPVTGSANAAICTWLHASDSLPARRFTSSQGREVGRDGIVECRVDDGDEVWIGGQTQTVVSGVMNW